MQASEVYKRTKSSFLSIALVLGYTRPTTNVVPHWGLQQTSTPWDDSAPIVATAVDVASQLSKAFDFSHPLDDLHSNLPPDLDAAIRWQCGYFSSGTDANAERLRCFSVFQKGATDLEGWSDLLSRSSPSFIRKSPAPLPHYALFECCIDALELPDERLGEDLVCGAPCVGEIPDSGNFRPVHDPESIHVEDLDNAAWHHQLVRDITAAADDPSLSEEHSELWSRTQKEVDDGWAIEIGTLADARTFFGGDAFRASRRFGVTQKSKIRPCENCRASLHNLATSLAETITTESADFPARVASLYSSLLADSNFSIRIGTEDISSAYRRAACSQPWFTVFAQWDPVRKDVRFFRLVGMNFGLRSAPVNFNRISFAMTRIAVRLLRLACSNFYDDFCIVEPSFLRGGQQLLRDMAALLRLPFDGSAIGLGKSERAALRNTFLGVVHDFTSFAHSRFSTATVDPVKIRVIIDSIDLAIKGSSLDAASGGALKLCGRLQFALSWGCRRFGRAALQPIFSAAGSRTSADTTPPVLAALTFLRDLLADPDGNPRLRPRRFDYRKSPLPTVLIWSDARWEPSHSHPGGIGFVVFFPASSDAEAAARSSHSPPWMAGASTPPGEWFYAAYDLMPEEYAHWQSRATYIGQLELLAAIAVYYSLADKLRGRRVLHFVDNSGAVACLVKDYSADYDSSALVHSFWALAVALDIDTWFVFVNSEANLADWPSRGLLSFAQDLAASRISGDSLILPPQDSWGSVEYALLHSTASSLAPSRGRKRRRVSS
jgi:hypothetical protein